MMDNEMTMTHSGKVSSTRLLVFWGMKCDIFMLTSRVATTAVGNTGYHTKKAKRNESS
jgi:hypothetical protein